MAAELTAMLDAPAPAPVLRENTEPSSPVLVSVRRLEKRYGAFRAVVDLSVDVRRGEFLTLLGPSGSGKTTMLGLIAGLTPLDGGSILILGEDVSRLPPDQRNIGVVFQNYALFPHMTVEQNIGFPLRMQGESRSRIAERVQRMLDVVRLEGMGGRYPLQLSGGQQQRVALARALVFNPTVLLMDEPLSALDKNLRQQMQMEIKELQRKLSLTIICVTHDQEEALAMSDRVAVMNAGSIEQVGTPEDLYERPATRFVAEFVGESNIVACQVERAAAGLLHLRTPQGHALTCMAGDRAGIASGASVTVMVRPERVTVGETAMGLPTSLRGVVEAVTYVGDQRRCLIDAGGLRLVARLASHRGPACQRGDAVQLGWGEEDACVIPG